MAASVTVLALPSLAEAQAKSTATFIPDLLKMEQQVQKYIISHVHAATGQGKFHVNVYARVHLTVWAASLLRDRLVLWLKGYVARLNARESDLGEVWIEGTVDWKPSQAVAHETFVTNPSPTASLVTEEAKKTETTAASAQPTHV